MIKDPSDIKLACFAILNFSLAGVKEALANLEPYMHFALAFGQIAVAVVTVVFVIKKIKALKQGNKVE
jgi:hypothetical protein